MGDTEIRRGLTERIRQDHRAVRSAKRLIWLTFKLSQALRAAQRVRADAAERRAPAP